MSRFNIAMFSLMCGLASLGLTAHAEIYKWTDANGKTQYSDSPPASAKAKADVLKTEPAPAAVPKGQSWEEKDRDFQARKARQGATQPSEEQSRQYSKRMCDQARSKLAAMNGAAVYRAGKNGERVYIEDNERAVIEKEAKATMAQHCQN
jgi:hypothetical protein